MTLPASTLGREAAAPVSSASSAGRPFALTTDAQPVARIGLAPGNHLLATLPDRTLSHLRRHLERVTLESREVLFLQHATMSHVYFPETAVVSLVSQLSDGRTVEVATTGCEGLVGLPVFFGSASSSTSAFVQIPGTALRMDAGLFQRATEESDSLHRLLLRYTQAFLAQVTQTAACNGAHLVEQRCARWLLMTHDRVAGDEFPLTHEFLALMLSVRRPGVTLAMRALQDGGLVRCLRGRVEVVDRPGLERISCECYGVVRRQFAHLLPDLVT